MDPSKIYNHKPAGHIVACENPELVRLEADYILVCQYLKQNDVANGAINNVYGAPTWVVPRENAMAILGLLRAHECLNIPNYVTKANDCMNYLIKIQPQDGGWFDQYKYANVADRNKSPTQTAEVLIAMNKLGFQPNRYTSMTKGADFLISLQNPSNKYGLDDGLVCGGLDDSEHYQTWRWASDNAYSYQALKAAARWAGLSGDIERSEQYEVAAGLIIAGINTYLKDPTSPIWRMAIDAQGLPIPGVANQWIHYAPAMLNVPVNGASDPAVGEWIYQKLVHQPESAAVQDDGHQNDVLSPGYSFQASLVWIKLGQTAYRDAAWKWASSSGLQQRSIDDNGISGGWIDWIRVTGFKAKEWERFIDTSFYFIAQDSGGYDFRNEST